MMVLRNMQRRRTFYWPWMSGSVVVVLPGETFEVNDSELAADATLRQAVRLLIAENVLAVVAVDQPALLH